MGTEAAIIGSAAVGGGLSLLGARQQSKAASKAADAQSRAMLEMYYQTREDLAPWREAGVRAIGSLEDVTQEYADVIRDPSLYVQSPGYDWLRQQGMKNIGRQASAAGQFGSGGYDKDLISYNQGLALQDYGGYLGRMESLLNRYAGTAGMGQTSSHTLANIGQNAANVSGAAQAAGYIGQANARTGLYNNLSNIGSNAVNQYMMWNYLQKAGSPQSQNFNPSWYGGG